MFVLVMILLLVLKISCEQDETTKAYLTGSSHFLKLLSTPKSHSFSASKQQSQKDNKLQANNDFLLDNDLEFPLENCNRILLDNRDAEIISQRKGIKRFVPERTTEDEVLKHEESSDRTVLNPRAREKNCVVKRNKSFSVDRKRRQVFHKNKFKKQTYKYPQSSCNFSNNQHKLRSYCNYHKNEDPPSHKRDISSDLIASDLSARKISYGDHDRMDISEYRPGDKIGSNINIDGKQRKANNEPPLLSDDYAHDTDFNQMKMSHQNHEKCSALEAKPSTQKPLNNFTTENNLTLSNNKTTIGNEPIKNVPSAMPSEHLDFNNKNHESNGTTSNGPANTTIPVKKGTTEDSCISLFEQSSTNENMVNQTGRDVTAINQVTEGKDLYTSILKSVGETPTNSNTETSLPVKADFSYEIVISVATAMVKSLDISPLNLSELDKSTINKGFLEQNGFTTMTNLNIPPTTCNQYSTCNIFNFLMNLSLERPQYLSSKLNSVNSKRGDESSTTPVSNINCNDQAYASNLTNFTSSVRPNSNTEVTVANSLFSLPVNIPLQSTQSLLTNNISTNIKSDNISLFSPMPNPTSGQDFCSHPNTTYPLSLYGLASTFCDNSFLAPTVSLPDNLRQQQNIQSLENESAKVDSNSANIVDRAHLSNLTDPELDSNQYLKDLKAIENLNIESQTTQVNGWPFLTTDPYFSPPVTEIPSSSSKFGKADDLNYCLSLFCVKGVFNQITTAKIDSKPPSKFATSIAPKVATYSPYSALPGKSNLKMTKIYKSGNNVPTNDPCLPQERKDVKSKVKAFLDNVTPKSIYYAFHSNKTRKEHEKYSLRFVSGIPHTTKSISSRLNEIVWKINNTIHKVKKAHGTTKSPIIKLTHHHHQEPTQPISVIKKMLGLSPKHTKAKSSTNTSKHILSPDECITQGSKGSKAHPFRHKGGDPGNHYLHGKPKLITAESKDSTVEHVSQFSSYSNKTTYSTDTTFPTDITKLTETEEAFIPRLKGAAHSNQVLKTIDVSPANANANATMCEENDIKEILPQTPHNKIIF